MALENPYCSLQQVQKETGNSDADLSTWFEDCINLASRYIDVFTQKDFLPHDHTTTPYQVKRDMITGKLITLPYPIVSITELLVRDLVFDPDYYEWDEGKRVIELALTQGTAYPQLAPYVTFTAPGIAKWDKGKGAITIKGVLGYTKDPGDTATGIQPLTRPCTDLPSAIIRATAKIAAAWSHEKRRERATMDGNRVSLLDERIPDDAALLLKRYKPLVL